MGRSPKENPRNKEA